MFGSRILEVAIGIVFVFLVVSIICSALREVIEAQRKSRAAYLEHGIRELMHDPGAGAGIWNDVTNGNSNFIGIEAENTGGANDFPWPAVQVDAYQRGVAAILKFVGQPADACAGHKEYARPLGRKQDPVFNMNEFRTAIDAILNGRAPAPVLIPAMEPGDTGRPTLRRGDKGDLIEVVQQKLGVETTGTFGPKTEAAVRALQRSLGMVPDGIVGPRTWAALDART